MDTAQVNYFVTLIMASNHRKKRNNSYGDGYEGPTYLFFNTRGEVEVSLTAGVTEVISEVHIGHSCSGLKGLSS